MSYRLYSTRKADYAQAYCVHNLVTKDKIFSKNSIKNLDAIVLETGAILSPHQVINFQQYSAIEETIRKNNLGTKIYLTDIAPREIKPDSIDYITKVLTNLGIATVFGNSFYYLLTRVKISDDEGNIRPLFKPSSRRKFLGISLGALGTVLVSNSSTIALTKLINYDDETNVIWPRIMETRYNLEHTALVTLRDAINAKKIEEFVVPELTDKLGRRPRIGLVYGAAHAGMETCLKEKSHRESILKEFKNYDLLLPQQLGVVVEMEYNNNWDVIIHETSLFAKS